MFMHDINTVAPSVFRRDAGQLPSSRVEEHTYGVTELGRVVTRAVQRAFPDEVWVRGEIQNLSRPASGHVYFDLVDPEVPGRATLPVVLFESAKMAVNVHLQRSGAGRMIDGTEVRIRGIVDFYAPDGQIQLRMNRIDAEYTLGRLAAARERLLRQLAAESLLDANSRLTLPPVPLRVGLVTSAGSAAATDFVEELKASGQGWRVTMADARVQGADSERSVAAALAAVVRHDVDVVALVRGGGSRTDLAPFDGEVMARAIAACPVPVLTGIGHEVDDTIADRVAHTAFKTPTACAAGLVEIVRSFTAAAEAAWSGIRRAVTAKLRDAEGRVEGASRRLLRSTQAAVTLSRLAMAQAQRRLLREAGQVTDRSGSAVDDAARRLAQAGRRISAASSRELDAVADRVRALDPARILARGWSITKDSHGAVVRTVTAVEPDAELLTVFADGEVASRVESVRPAGQDADDQQEQSHAR